MDDPTVDALMLAMSDDIERDLAALDTYSAETIWADVPESLSAQFASMAGL